MGNSEVGHLTIGAGRVVYQDLVRINRAIEDGSLLRERGARRRVPRARRSAAATSTCSGSSPTAASTRTSTTCGRCSSSPAARAWPSGRWSTRSRTAATSRRTPPRRPRRARRRGRAHRDGLRPLLRDGPRRALGADGARASRAIVAGEGQQAEDPARRGRGELRRAASPTSSSSRSCSPGAAARRRTTRRSSSTSAPTARASSRRSSSRPGFDLTTMTRYRDDFDCPVAFEEQDVRNTMAEVLARARRCASCTWPRRRSTRTSRTSSTAASRTEWEGETRILVPSPRDVPTYDQKPEMSARGGRRPLLRRDRQRLPLRDRQLREPGHGRPHRRHPRRRRAPSRPWTPASAASSRRVHEPGGVCLVTADHGNAEQLLEADGVSPHTAHTTNPVPLVVTLEEAELATDGTLADLAPDRARRCSESLSGGDDGSNRSNGSREPSEPKVITILRAYDSGRSRVPLPQPDLAVLRKAQKGDERAFRSSSRRTSSRSSTTSCAWSATARSPRTSRRRSSCASTRACRASRSAAGSRPGSSRSAKNRVLDELRARERRPQALVALEDMPPLEVVDAPPERVEAIDAVWRAVGR